jgi:hypothetical protein
MPVSVKGSGGGGVTLDAGAAASDTTLTLPNVSGTVLQSGTAVTVAQGGTGATSLTSGGALIGNGTSAVTAVSPTTTGNVLFTTNGTSWSSTAKIVSGTAVTSTSGTAIDFTGIPSWVKRITLIFNEVSTSGSAGTVVQLGTGATPTYTASGYLSTSVGTAGAPGATSYTNGFGIRNDNAAYVLSGHMVLTNISGNIWISSHVAKASTAVCPVGGGSVTLSAALTAVRFASANGTDTFDAGTINIIYE